MVDPIFLVVNPIVNNIINTTRSLIEEEYDLFHDVKNELEKLSSNLTTIQAVLNDAEEKQLDESSVRDWLVKLKDAAYDVEDILDTFATKASLWKQKQQVRKFQIPIGINKTSYKSAVTHKIKELSARLDVIAADKEKLHLNTNVDVGRPKNQPQPGSFVDTSDVFGREADNKEIIKMLLSEEYDKEGDISVIPIIGMGGIGKTTLAQFVFNDERVKDHFEYRMWVCVTVDFDLRRILREMIEMIVVPSKMKYDPNLSQRVLDSRLLDFLDGQRFLLVLDDVCNDYGDWEPLQKLLKQVNKGSRILVTSRNAKVSDVFGTQPSYQLKDLPEGECWSLFEKVAFKDDNLPRNVRKELEDIGKQIVDKCKGLPLAVKAMGGLLRGNSDVRKWQKILRSSIWELDLAALKFSYNYLPTYLKQCFVYCSIFPKAYVFNKEDLVKLWMAEAFIQSGAQEKLEDIGIKYFEELLMRSFFQTFKIDNKVRYRMHDLIHDLAQSISGPYCCQVQDNKSCNCSEQSRHVSLLCEDVEEPALKIVGSSKKLRTLLMPSEHLKTFGQALDKIFRTLKYIRVLDLSSSMIVELPSSIKELKLLRYLDLSKTEIKVLPNSICSLYNLQTLKLLGCHWLFELPRDLGNLINLCHLELGDSKLEKLPSSIEELKLLRYLDLSKTELKVLPNSICSLYNLQTLKLLGCPWIFELPKDLRNLIKLCHLELDDMFWFKSSTLPQRIGNLTSLHNLHAFRVGCKSGYGIEELKDMACLTGTLHISGLENAVKAGEAKLKEKEGLEKVVFEWSNRDVNQKIEAAEEYPEEMVLEDLQPHLNLKELQIVHYTGTRFPTWMRDGMLRNLVTISLNRCTKCKILTLGQLPKLGALYIKEMLELEEWTETENFFLNELKISNCPKLKKLPNLFHILEELKIKNCGSLKALPVTPSLMFLKLVDNFVLEDLSETAVPFIFENDQGQREDRPLASLINLLEMKVVNCPKLQVLPQFFAPRKLNISGCELLSALLAPELAERLQQLTLDSCEDATLLRLIPNTSSLDSLVISKISNIASLPKWPHLPGLKALHICNCNDLLSLSEEEEGSLRSLTSLKLLSVRDCPKLTTLPREGLPTRLECLSIGSCPSLKSLGPKELLKNLTSLEYLYIENCPLLESLPEDGLPSSLKHLCIQECPKLRERCQEEDGADWPKIMHIPDMEIDFIKISLAPNVPNKKASSSAWFNRFVCSKGFDISEIEQPGQQSNSLGLMQRQKESNWKGKRKPAEPSSSAEHGQ